MGPLRLLPSLLLSSLLLQAACAEDLRLPPEPSESAAPHIDAVEPAVAIASLGSPVLLQGRGLAAVETVRVGPLVLSRGEFRASENEILLHVTADLLERHGVTDLDGDALPVRVAASAGEDTALQPLRVFGGVSRISEIAPADTAPGEMVFLRGQGFDPDVLFNNEVTLVAAGASGCESGGVPLDEPPCAALSVFWATRGLVIAVLPQYVPAGPARIEYRNVAFEEISDAAESWSSEGRNMGDFLATPPAVGAPATPESIGMAAGGVERDSGVLEHTMVWRDPGFLVVGSGEKKLAVTAEHRLCYPDSARPERVDARLRVLIDGWPVPNDYLECGTVPTTLLLSLPSGYEGMWDGPDHSLQVVTPFHQSPVAWFQTPI